MTALPAVRVLVVDDQEGCRDVARSVVEHTPGFAVIGEACTGAEAVAACDRLRPDLVLMDVRMPEMNGTEARQRIVAAHPETCVVLLSAYASPTIAPKAGLSPAFVRAAWSARRSSSGTIPVTTVPEPHAEPISS